ncbi:hypothetical protein KAM429_18130 [Aquipseudomonas alcaligenes]|uniref:Uncharacterized protein n=1 Tax=Aquipseudomonas alcaligenes TaxID=43263 RepID=A0AA37CG93_AQUAC|nr:hypothetical protein [Pseudomonas alcaligenes]BCR22834.1 hypothetical protein KAM426_03610 [Pseudomonas alcaligenes]GIZ67377.1 hypothetical protein KAM428_24620 [Pseudomonas alcaligenes]GIZ71052.1 hypothetical protein KAM429_18130 [Pseudomonas alcaligenes]GIZ75399.1 hypothetical protein KAM430_18080 [Pseudomonas alcaligenes]GIZ80134.1 hypothetical protein KAM432_21820 [Pseudomonas alcaligenes]
MLSGGYCPLAQPSSGKLARALRSNAWLRAAHDAGVVFLDQIQAFCLVLRRRQQLAGQRHAAVVGLGNHPAVAGIGDQLPLANMRGQGRGEQLLQERAAGRHVAPYRHVQRHARRAGGGRGMAAPGRRQGHQQAQLLVSVAGVQQLRGAAREQAAHAVGEQVQAFGSVAQLQVAQCLAEQIGAVVQWHAARVMEQQQLVACAVDAGRQLAPHPGRIIDAVEQDDGLLVWAPGFQHIEAVAHLAEEIQRLPGALCGALGGEAWIVEIDHAQVVVAHLGQVAVQALQAEVELGQRRIVGRLRQQYVQLPEGTALFLARLKLQRRRTRLGLPVAGLVGVQAQVAVAILEGQQRVVAGRHAEVEKTAGAHAAVGQQVAFGIQGDQCRLCGGRLQLAGDQHHAPLRHSHLTVQCPELAAAQEEGQQQRQQRPGHASRRPPLSAARRPGL